jgi:hypothetical protein
MKHTATNNTSAVRTSNTVPDTHFKSRNSCVPYSTAHNHARGRTVGLDEGGGQLGDLLHVGVALDAVLGHAAVHGNDLVLKYNLHRRVIRKTAKEHH